MFKRIIAEILGTAMLVMTPVGASIMGERLAGDNPALILLVCSISTGAMLVVLITILSPISGAHLNPVVSFFFYQRGDLPKRDLVAYSGAQLIGACFGVVLAHAMFDVPLVQISTTARAGLSFSISEMIATFGLIFVIATALTHMPKFIPALVGIYITAAYWFTGSTSFANPAATIGRIFTNSPAGIAPSSAIYYLIGELVGTGLAVTFGLWLISPDKPRISA